METIDQSRIKGIIESVLFVARKPLSPDQLAEVLELSPDVFQPVLDELLAEYQAKGITILSVAGGYLMGTNAENADYVQKVLRPKVETTLSPQALDTLAVIAYKQPVTRGEVERVRGVNSDYIMDTLISKRLIKEAGRSEALGHPYIYVTTEDFLRHFGLKDLSELPPLPFDINEEPVDYRSVLPEEQVSTVEEPVGEATIA
ncbi:SMC-Scp complex subunit ScpB [candidate division WOR-1 bacterium RIFOXYA12_FULL_52_29]|uniref:Segregation and condensation protein B n=1 Tax=candidate division WOR-1 bacterium RIFOXYC12_FULL_54_18 TaxID=1802584 RepID=A0A1F4T4B9_UNCSA|nr:MAG: SMC-Scp complex subunit ScpB [candidate division WOR-1 bacterium RIFOXYA2_FULL_51_19]OGC17111.1 MAG: SMC-Scp complex subunit ScpB [candidate division WOR-1 bacterium RIFOXYA12_FULL_52_29]OGC25971.1 MAG: SMC-Scp complex subunit ScpB [candidate division WOR-1 bacterium RIFOXYB2_FULL_45_9]OGC27528.1 MAG: SMC-Scp complex subunit ScpB [candidate division WOR-1 bacterium RIFOXYC12_FULL_54_18]OGC29259.1 MAG: SMC-Scp complex subunit ScpB [candidate division WOR-1 bacterium RIFOXYB12_FULL_52_16]